VSRIGVGEQLKSFVSIHCGLLSTPFAFCVCVALDYLAAGDQLPSFATALSRSGTGEHVSWARTRRAFGKLALKLSVLLQARQPLAAVRRSRCSRTANHHQLFGRL